MLGIDLWGQVFSHLLDPDYRLPFRCVFKMRLVCRLFRDAVRKRFMFAHLLEKLPLVNWSHKEAELAVDAVQAFRFVLSFRLAHPNDPFLSVPGNRVLALRSRSSTMVVMDGWTSETGFTDERLVAQLADGRVCVAHTLSATDGQTGQDDAVEWSDFPPEALQLAAEAIGIHSGPVMHGESPPPEKEIQFLKSFAERFLLCAPLSASREEDVVYLSVLASLAHHKAVGGGPILSSYCFETPREIAAIFDYVQTMAEARARIMLDSYVVIQIGLFFTSGSSGLGQRENRVDITVHGLPFALGFVRLLDDQKALQYVRDRFFPAAHTTEDLVGALVSLDENLKRVWQLLDGVELSPWKELAP